MARRTTTSEEDSSARLLRADHAARGLARRSIAFTYCRRFSPGASGRPSTVTRPTAAARLPQRSSRFGRLHQWHDLSLPAKVAARGHQTNLSLTSQPLRAAHGRRAPPPARRRPLHHPSICSRRDPLFDFPRAGTRRFRGLPITPSRGYLISTGLGVTADRGATPSMRSRKMIRRPASAAADSTPKGTSITCINQDTAPRLASGV